MASEIKNHLQKTAKNKREEAISKATVIEIREESPTVKGLTLKIHDRQLSFKAGQWLDLIIPNVDRVGGYSMCTSPLKLAKEGTLDLAIKYSSHPPTYWVHTQCKVGDEVCVRIGGDFFFTHKSDGAVKSLLLLAGGVGINPLFSIINCVVDESWQEVDTRLSRGVPECIVLLFSAAVEDELLFKKQLDHMATKHEGITCTYFVTKQKGASSNLHYRRIGKRDLEQALEALDKNNTRCYLCGPSGMDKTLVNYLVQYGLSQEQIFYEKW